MKNQELHKGCSKLKKIESCTYYQGDEKDNFL